MADPVSWRFDPFTESYSAVKQEDEDQAIPAGSPYRVRLNESPREDSPSSVEAVILVELDEDLDDSETGVDVLAAEYGRVQVNDVILCDDEQMLVSAKPGSPTLTVTRGYSGTTPDTHSTGTQMEILNSLTEITSGSPATREFRVDYKYNTGLVLFNSAEAEYDVRFDYYGLGSPLHAGIIWTEDNIKALAITTAKLASEAGTVAKLKFAETSSNYAIATTATYTIRVQNDYIHGMQSYEPTTSDIVCQAEGLASGTGYRFTYSWRNTGGGTRTIYYKYLYHASSPEFAKMILDMDQKPKGIMLGMATADEIIGCERTKAGVVVPSLMIAVPSEIVSMVKKHKDFQSGLNKFNALSAERLFPKMKRLYSFLKASGLEEKEGG